MRPILTKSHPILRLFMPPPPTLTPDKIHAAASEWTLRGIARMKEGTPQALSEALQCFEQAILLRAPLPLKDRPLFRWGLTAGWMNRGDVLTRLGGEECLREALRSYDVAIAHLHRLPLDADPAFRWRLGVAWINRGITEQALAGTNALPNPLHCFENALTVMRGQEESTRPDYQQVMAAAWMNRANALLQKGEIRSAYDSAEKAIQHSRTFESTTPNALAAGIKARHILCQAVAHLLEVPGDKDSSEAERWIHAATDAVEEAMNLTKDDSSFTQLREELFHFGCRIYRAFQPHFLAEFLNDGLSAGAFSEAMRNAAKESLTQAAFQIQQENLAGCNPDKLDRLIGTLRALSETGQKLG